MLIVKQLLGFVSYRSGLAKDDPINIDDSDEEVPTKSVLGRRKREDIDDEDDKEPEQGESTVASK